MPHQQIVYMIGIGGSGMSALAQVLVAHGKKVIGSDKSASETTDKLVKEGIIVKIGHDVTNLPDEIELCVISPAIPKKNLELQEIRSRDIPVITYPEAIGLLSEGKYTIAIAGTHGKTTTTAMLGTTLLAASYDPTIIVGTPLRELNNNNVFIGKSKYLVVEACEYKKSFLALHPDILVILNIDMDHYDYYKTEEEYRDAFIELVKKVPQDGYIVAKNNDETIDEVVKHAHCTVLRFGPRIGEYTLHGDIINHKFKQLGTLELQIPGEHNRMNALAAFAVCHMLHVPMEITMPNLYRYKGAKRRLELKGHIGSTKVYDDYAHHPKEIEATVAAIKEQYPQDRLCCVFQPHQYNRTKHLLKDFGKSFTGCDQAVISEIYEVRDSKDDVASVSTEDLVSEIKKNGVTAHYGKGIEETAVFIKEHAADFDTILVMGAGDIYKVNEALIDAGIITS